MKLFSLPTLFLCITTCVFSLNANEDNPYHSLRPAAISGATGTPWSASRHIELVEKASQMRPTFVDNANRLSYPISEEDFLKLLEKNHCDTIPFFAYSSMIDKNAGAVKAISTAAAETQIPAIAFGIQRTFNRRLPESTVEAGYGALRRSNDVGILNVFEKEDAVINGVLFHLPLSDLQILSKREVGYDLIPVLVMNWEEAIKGQGEPDIFLAYTFLAPEVTTEVTPYTSSHVNPIPGYVYFLQKGLDDQGESFKAMWWATTFLGDMKTSVKELPYQEIDLKAP